MKKIILLYTILLSVMSVEGQKDSDGFIIIGDSTNFYKSVDDILKLEEFKNKVVYVDIWGTRCGPCLREFEYISELKQRFSNEPLAFAYLCSPYTVEWDQNNAELWRTLIEKYNLEGINVLMSAECYESGFFEKYKHKYSSNRLYGIPTYLLVDMKGQIVNFDAPRPSKKEILYEEIQALIDE